MMFSGLQSVYFATRLGTEPRHGLLEKFRQFVVCNPCRSSPCSFMDNHYLFGVFFYLRKLSLSGYFQFNCVSGQNTPGGGGYSLI